MSILSIFKKKPELARDPICHMMVDPSKARASSEYESIYLLLLCTRLQDDLRRSPGETSWLPKIPP